MRGQVGPRCPECGRAFDFADAATFDTELPGVLLRTHRWLAHRRFKVLAVLLALTIGMWWMTADEMPIFSRRIHPSVVSASHLKQILTTWMIHQYEGQPGTPFNREKAIRDLRGNYSAYEQYSKGRFRAAWELWRRSGWLFLHMLSLAVCLFAIVIYWQGTRRRLALAGSLMVLLVIGDGVMNNTLLHTLFPGSHAFLDDYVYLNDVDLMSSRPERGNTIAAYERTPWPVTRRRLVGFADGHVVRMFEDKFIQLLKSQGHELDPSARREDPPK